MAKHRDEDLREFDMTSLHERSHGASLTRDYSAHFFKWSFARRVIGARDHVLEVGCGVERPLFKILCTSTIAAKVERYVGVDLNKLPAWEVKRADFIGEFNFARRWQELRKRYPRGFDKAVCLEVIEHMQVRHGRQLLRGLYENLKPGGVLALSTPCYDGKHHAANHIHEYEVGELKRELERAGFVVTHRFGTFMNTREIGKRDGVIAPELLKAVRLVRAELMGYYDDDALACIFAPLYPDHARNNLWLVRRPL